MPTVTGQVQRPTSNTPWDYATVRIALAGSGLASGGVIRAGYAQAQTDVNGNVSFDLPGNNAGEVYVWTNPDRTQRQFQMPASGGPYTLDALAVTVTPQAQPAVTQDSLASQLTKYVPQLATAGNYTYNPDGTVATDPDGNSYGYNGDGTVHTITKAGVTRTASYNTDGTIASWA